MKPHTESVCPVCLKRIPAQRTERDGNIYLEKTCPEHGFFRTLIWEGKPDYQSWGKAPRATRVLSDERVQRGCPYDCGLCSQHRQRSCCVLLEVTQRCNLGCPVCFAEAGGETADPDLHSIEAWFDRLCELAPKANIQLSGGEPTVRDDLPEIIRLGREKGFSFFQLNTNGLRLAREPDYAAKLKAAGLSCVFLQFDGVDDAPYIALRGRPLFEEKCRAVQNCAAAQLGVVLTPTLAMDVNLDQVGEIIRFAMERLPAVRGVHFQPMSYFGRYPGAPEKRVTLPRLCREIEAQTRGAFSAEDFLGGSAEHPLCSFSCNYILRPDGTVENVSPRSSSCCCCSDDGEEDGSEALNPRTAVEKARDTVSRRWGGAVPEAEAPPDDLDGLDGMLYLLRHRRFSLSAMAFQDAWNLDLERLQNCYVHVLSPDGRLIPFCAYNLTSAEGKALHRR